METLFSFELLVDNIQVDVGKNVFDELAVALRLLDFPTLVIYQPEKRKEGNGEDGKYVFNKGKACFFKMNMSSLHSQLSNTPLYAMVLDVKEEMPKFVGSSQISLAKIMDKIKRDVAEKGTSAPSSHGQRGTVAISNLKGENVGLMSLSVKILSLGSSLEPHVNGNIQVKPNDEACLEERTSKKEAEEISAGSENVKMSNLDEANKVSKNGEATKREEFASKCDDTDSFGEDTCVFYPPLLYYNNSAEERVKHEEEGQKQLTSNLEAYTNVDNVDETHESLLVNAKKHNNVSSSVQEQQEIPDGVTPNVIGQALQQMPLLNALLLELSQLNSLNATQPSSVHPHLAWMYGPASPEAWAAERNTSQKEPKNRQAVGPGLKDLSSPTCCSTPIRGEWGSTPRKKLVYGSTKSFNLRLMRHSPATGKEKECLDLIGGRTPLNPSREQSKVVKKLTESRKRLTKTSKLNENIETLIENIAYAGAGVESQTNLDDAACTETQCEDRSISEKPMLFENPSRHVSASSERGNSEKINQSSPDSHGGKRSGSSRNSVDSSVSDRSGGEDDYPDDFNSFQPSDAFSPDPSSPSPELQRPKTLQCHPDLARSSDSSPEIVRKSSGRSRAVIPVPIQVSRSPQRALRGTYTVQRQTFGVSFSSEDGDRARASSRLSGKLFRDSTREERSSRESLRSSHRSDDASRETERGIVYESSFEHKTEEEEDELGTLDFKKGYKHISELVVHKLPGYTL